MSKVSAILSKKFADEEAAIVAEYKKALKALDEAKDAKIKLLTSKKDTMYSDLEKMADSLYEKREDHANTKAFVSYVQFMGELFESPLLEDNVNRFIFGGGITQRKFSEEKTTDMRKFIEFHPETIGENDFNKELFDIILMILAKKILPQLKENIDIAGSRSWADMSEESIVPPVQGNERAVSAQLDQDYEHKIDLVQLHRATTENTWVTVANSRRTSPSIQKSEESLNDLPFMLRDVAEQRNKIIEDLVDKVNERYDEYISSVAFNPKSGKIHPYVWLKSMRFMNTSDIQIDLDKIFPTGNGVYQYDLEKFYYEKHGVKIVYAVPTSGYVQGRATWHEHPDISSKNNPNADLIIWKRYTTDFIFFLLKLNQTKGTIEAYKYVPVAGEYKGVKNTSPALVDDKYIDASLCYTDEEGSKKPSFTKLTYAAALKLTKF